MRILCLLGWHSWKKTTKNKNTEYFKCGHCLTKKKLAIPELCPSCKTKLMYAAGIGLFCPKVHCERIDDVR